MGAKTLHLTKKEKRARAQAEAELLNAQLSSKQPRVHLVKNRKADIILPIPAQPTMTTETQTQGAVQAETQAAQEQAAQPTSMMELAQSLVPFTVLSPFASCLVTPEQLDSAIAANYNEIYIYHNGQFFQHMQLIGNRHVRLKVDGLPTKFKSLETHLKEMLPSVEESMNFLPSGKIPGALWDQIVEFFRQVSRTKSSEMEAHAWILWNAEQGYHIHVPKQIVSKASVQYDFDVPAGNIIVVDVHSHNTMGAFYSGTDNNDDKDKVYYTGVVGKLTKDSYEWVLRFNLREKKLQAKLDDIFDLTTEVNIPAGWLDQVEVRSYQSGKAQSQPSYTPGGYSQWIANKEKERQNASGSNGSSGKPGDSPTNPAVWTAADSIKQQQQGGSSQGDMFPFPRSALVAPFGDDDDDTLGFGGQGSSSIVWPAHQPVEGGPAGATYDGERDVFSRAPANKRAELEELLAGIPESSMKDMDERDRRVTEWLAQNGYDADGNDMLAAAADDIREMKGQTVEDDTDPVGGQNNAYEIVDAMITDLEGNDEALMDIATQCYHLMSDKGRQKIQTNGLGS